MARPSPCAQELPEDSKGAGSDEEAEEPASELPDEEPGAEETAIGEPAVEDITEDCDAPLRPLPSAEALPEESPAASPVEAEECVGESENDQKERHSLVSYHRMAPTLVSNAPRGVRKKMSEANFGSRSADGRSLEDSYEVVCELGGGATSHVYFAKDRRTHEQRALKVLDRTQFDDEFMTESYEAYKEATDSFHTEVSVLQTVDHPHIVRLYDAFENRGCFVLAMEFCPGGCLFDYLDLMENLTEHTVASCIRQVALALCHLHSLQICHCDLKPENVLVSGEMTTSEGCIGPFLKLADFGVAVLKGASSVAVGASGYAAPEVKAGGQCGEAGDIWSLGMLGFVMLSGMDPAGVRQLAMFNELPPLQLVSDVGYAFVSVCLNSIPTSRISAVQALGNPWLAAESPDIEASQLSEVLRRLKEFGKLNRLQRTIMQVMAYTISVEKIAELPAIFERLDIDQNGVLTLEEFRDGFKRVQGDCKEYDEIFDALDFEHSHTIHYNEFVAACLGRKRYLHRDVLWNAFCAIDVQRNGFICFENLQELLKSEVARGTFSEEQLHGMFSEIDVDHDGRISFSDFRRLMVDGQNSSRVRSRSQLDDESVLLSPLSRQNTGGSEFADVSGCLETSPDEDTKPFSFEGRAKRPRLS